MSTSHWTDFHRRWARLKPPLRPDEAIVEAFRSAVAERRERVLLLGVTMELANIGAETIAVDHSAMMIAHVWPGDTAQRHAVNADWQALPFPASHFSAAVGDGCLSAVAYPGGQRGIFGQLSRIVKPGGRFVARLFQAPDQGETISAVGRSAMTRQIRSFHAFKWRLAMAIVAKAADPNIKVQQILDVFEREFPDRAGLARATGWPAADIDTIDVYRGSPEVYSFPTFAQLRTTIPKAFSEPRLLSVGKYELAERCPFLILDLKP